MSRQIAREIPEEACAHNNEEILHGENNPYKNTEVQCLDCGSVRQCATFHGEKDRTHSECL